MGFTVIGGSVDLEQTPVQIGDENTGVIIHDEPGVTKDGVSVDAAFWVEIYGAEIHFSEGE